MRQTQVAHQFVDFIPEQLSEGVLYISRRYRTAAHKCCCGCGKEVITPITPADWSLRVEGNSISLYPSIGNWSIPCKSHYWIHRSKVIWAAQMPEEQIEYGRKIRRSSKKAFLEAINHERDSQPNLSLNQNNHNSNNDGFLGGLWKMIMHWWRF